MVVVADRAVTGDGDETAEAGATEAETMLEMMMEMTMIGEIADVLGVVEAGGLEKTTKASHHCRRPRETVGRIPGRRPRRARA